jgi:hypothetical protein
MSFEEETERGRLTRGCGCAETSGEVLRQIMRLQVVTLIWMVVECALALFSAWRARSPVLLAFGADSLIESLCLPCRHNPCRLGSQCGASYPLDRPRRAGCGSSHLPEREESVRGRGVLLAVILVILQRSFRLGS